ncbi:MAG: endonuclease VIII [Clostridiales bacterium]|nr:endonuclease VIII [Clostridiales bacterium]
MLEIPEAIAVSRQLNETIKGRQIKNVIAAKSPHKFAWYSGDPAVYDGILSGRVVDGAEAVGGMIEVRTSPGDRKDPDERPATVILLFSDGVNLRYHGAGDARPEKHQLLVEFEEGCAISASVQMYGGLCCFEEGGYDNKYYKITKEKPSPLTEAFSLEYFERIVDDAVELKLAAKALLATEQRIPGLGNGSLQDILYNAGIHPKRKVASFSESDRTKLFGSIKSTIKEMAESGGRDTEKDLFGGAGGYAVKLSKNTADKPCPKCGSLIRKESYMGGSIYYCAGCQSI